MGYLVRCAHDHTRTSVCSFCSRCVWYIHILIQLCFSLHARAQGFSVEDQGAATAAKPPTTWDVKVLVAALLTVVSQRLFNALG